jgi:hypothetical protein
MSRCSKCQESPPLTDQSTYIEVPWLKEPLAPQSSFCALTGRARCIDRTRPVAGLPPRVAAFKNESSDPNGRLSQNGTLMLHRTHQVITPDAPGPASGRCPVRFQRWFCVTGHVRWCTTGRTRASDALSAVCHIICTGHMNSVMLASGATFARASGRCPESSRELQTTTEHVRSLSTWRTQRLNNNCKTGELTGHIDRASGACFSTRTPPKSSESCRDCEYANTIKCITSSACVLAFLKQISRVKS